MQLLYDFFPILIFFIVYKIWGIYAATASAIVISFLQMMIYWIRHHKFERLQVITFFLIAILGTTTIILHNPIFIKWKPTAINWAFALVFLSSHFIGEKPLIQYLMDKKVTLPNRVWSRLNLSWVIFFSIVGALNLYVIYHFSTNAWVNFKLFGVLGLTILFAIIQAIYLARHMTEVSEEN